MTEYSYQVGLLCPIENMDAANEAAVQLTGNPAAIDTFDLYHTVEKDGQTYVYAHGSFREVTYAQLPVLANALGGVYFDSEGDFWSKVLELGYTRPVMPIPEE